MKNTQEKQQEGFFYSELLETAFNCGLKILSDDFCCKLLAWLYVFGGSYEAALKNKKMNTDIQHAQKRLNIYGGEISNQKLVPLLKRRIKECGDFKIPKLPDWIDEIDTRYELKTKA